MTRIHTNIPPSYRRICITGHPKGGKTRLAGAFLRSNLELYGEQAIYVAADPDARDLVANGMLREDAARMLVVEPLPQLGEGEIPVIGPKPAGNYNPPVECHLIAARNWRADFPDVRTLIWDTGTTSARDILDYVALTEEAPGDSKDGRVTFGQRGKPGYHVAASRSDIFQAQNIVLKFLGNLLRQPLHIVGIFHEDLDEKRSLSGPATIGKKAITTVASMFAHVIRVTVQGQTRMARVGPHAQSIAGVRAPDLDPMQDVKLNPDPINFWHEFNTFLKGETS